LAQEQKYLLNQYKDYKIYCYFVLSRLVTELNIDLHQDGLEDKVGDILGARSATLTKEEIMHEIRSNHYMTNKVIKKLEEDGFVDVRKEEKRYRISITKIGVLHLRKYNEFYRDIYKEQIRDHYRYRGLPAWLR
jgi:predicted transcriptional regulator